MKTRNLQSYLCQNLEELKTVVNAFIKSQHAKKRIFIHFQAEVDSCVQIESRPDGDSDFTSIKAIFVSCSYMKSVFEKSLQFAGV